MMNRIYKLIARLQTDTQGLTAVEYAVLGAFVVAAVATVGATFDDSLTTAFNRLFSRVPS